MRDRDKENKADEIMKIALASKMEPDTEVNRRIIRKWKEQDRMSKQIRKNVYAVAAACSVLMITVTAGAAVKFLSPAEAVQKSGWESERMEEAFLGANAVEINESQEAGEYRFTLLGLATDEGLEESKIFEKADVQGEIYAIVAVEHLDGTAMPNTSEDAYAELEFFMSPLVEGLEPWQYNTASMGGSYSDFVENGILYRVIGSDDITMFADRELYLCVSDTSFYDNAAYHYNQNTGAISRNENYDGINVLFQLPIDVARADEEKASAYLASLEAEWKQEEEPDVAMDEEKIDAAIEDVSVAIDEIEREILNGEEEAALEGATLLSDKTKTVQKTNDRYEYELTLDDEEGTSILYFYENDFVDGKGVMICYGDYDEAAGVFESLYISVLTVTQTDTAEIQTYYKEL